MTRLRGVLLDVDGTLIDSNDQHAQAWADAFREFGYDIPAEMVRPLVGMLSSTVGSEAWNSRDLKSRPH